MSLPSDNWPTMPSPFAAPINSDILVNPLQAIRDYTEHVINGDRRQMCSAADKKHLEEWAKNDEYREVIVAVISDKLDLPWPYNYKALDILSCMPASEMAGLLDKVAKLSEVEDGVEGAEHLRVVARVVLVKGMQEKERVTAEAGEAGDGL